MLHVALRHRQQTLSSQTARDWKAGWKLRVLLLVSMLVSVLFSAAFSFYHQVRFFELTRDAGAIDNGPTPELNNTDDAIAQKNVQVENVLDVVMPTALRTGAERWMAENTGMSVFWDLLESYHPLNDSNYTAANTSFASPQYSLSWKHVCSLAPGRGPEQPGGYKLLADKIRVAIPNSTSPSSSSGTTRPRLFCGMYTYSRRHDLARTMALTWGRKCDGFLAFTTQDLPALGFLKIEHLGPEDYYNMWQKVRAIWKYAYDNLLHDFDYFHLCGDDTFLIVENLRSFLSNQPSPITNKLFFGLHVKHAEEDESFLAGGPGYTLSRASLEAYGKHGYRFCQPALKSSSEDFYMSRCMVRRLGVQVSETRDELGEQRYHATHPNELYTTEAGVGRSQQAKWAVWWETLLHPVHNTSTTVGRKEGLDSASTYSVAFHHISHPNFAARLFAIIYGETCPNSSILGRTLTRVHHIHSR